MTPEERQEMLREAGRAGGLKSWERTGDRTARTAPARAKSPSSVDYWLTKLDPELYADASEQQRFDVAENLRRAHFGRLALKSAQSRARKRKLRAAVEGIPTVTEWAAQQPRVGDWNIWPTTVEEELETLQAIQAWEAEHGRPVPYKDACMASVAAHLDLLRRFRVVEAIIAEMEGS